MRHRTPHPRALVALLYALLLLGVTVAAALAMPAARARGERDLPRLRLPGDRAVRPGQWIDVRWERTDHVREMELLLSRDGGRTYTAVTRELDPAQTHVLWRVPDDAGDGLRLRIRFDRDGREIEAPPEPLRIENDAPGGPEPFALPPLEGANAPRPASDREAPLRGSRTGGEFEESASSFAPAPPREVTHLAMARTRECPMMCGMCARARRPADRSPASVPLRP